MVAKKLSDVLQEAVVQYEQYEQEVRDLQALIEEAHRVIQDRPIPSSNIQELQAQILHHEVKMHTFLDVKPSIYLAIAGSSAIGDYCNDQE